ncbi:MAG: hypothetical protein II988_07315 [Clostridia bacterium]|nr:hypothetical protein [Clostridia bacterium]MBQ3597596.1 hypothetical protein [Clostridia bacterium]
MENFKRFTELKTYPNGKEGYIQYSVSGCYNDMNCKGDYTTGESVDRLAELENKIENKTLIDLPCKVDDVFYYANILTNEVEKHKVTAIEIGKEMRIRTICSRTKTYTYVGYFLPSYYGKTIFLTEPEAKARLKEMQNESTLQSD